MNNLVVKGIVQFKMGLEETYLLFKILDSEPEKKEIAETAWSRMNKYKRDLPPTSGYPVTDVRNADICITLFSTLMIFAVEVDLPYL